MSVDDSDFSQNYGLGFEGGHNGPIMSFDDSLSLSSGDPLDPLKFVQMRGGHLGKPSEVGSIGLHVLVGNRTIQYKVVEEG